METHRAYCSALDREVRVYVRPVQHDEMNPVMDDPPGIVCVEHGEECLGITCPLCPFRTGWLEYFERWLPR